ncbi:hypothetical protein M3Y99_01317600 [Aphelenchoides fujianensis]|nr:hypothetical protein M3Y99_01317600 [Aphelenchoides fujianensis]
MPEPKSKSNSTQRRRPAGAKERLFEKKQRPRIEYLSDGRRFIDGKLDAEQKIEPPKMWTQLVVNKVIATQLTDSEEELERRRSEEEELERRRSAKKSSGGKVSSLKRMLGLPFVTSKKCKKAAKVTSGETCNFNTLQVDPLVVGFVMEAEDLRDCLRSTGNRSRFLEKMREQSLPCDTSTFQWISFDERALLVGTVGKTIDLFNLTINGTRLVVRKVPIIETIPSARFKFARFDPRTARLLLFFALDGTRTSIVFMQQGAKNGNYERTKRLVVAHDLVDFQFSPDGQFAWAVVHEAVGFRLFRVDSEFRLRRTGIRLQREDRVIALNRGSFLLSRWRNRERSSVLYTNQSGSLTPAGCLYDELEDVDGRLDLRLTCKKRTGLQ